MLIHRRNRNPDPAGPLPDWRSLKIDRLDLVIPLLVIAVMMPPGIAAVTLSPDGSLDTASDLRLRSLGLLCMMSLGLLVLYPAAMDRVADLIRQRGRRMAVRSQGARPDQIIDVSSRAQRANRQALSLFMLEFIIFETVICGIFGWGILTVGGGVALVLAAGGVVLLRWLRRRTGIGHSRVRVRRSISVTVLVVVAVCVAVAGLFFFLVSATVSVNTEGRGGEMSLIGLILLGVSVALHRHARRISMSRVSPAVLADQRPPILYLRSFADDSLELRVVPFARPSLLERLSSRRKQGFEEVIAEELQQYGPVSAVSEPSRKLAPIGFIRESLTDADWQGHVRQRMEQSGVIIVTAGRSHGLEWEMQELIHSGSWRKAVFVFPPVPGKDALERWAKLASLLQNSGLRGIGLPAASYWLLAMTFTAEAEGRYYCAKYPNAWSYKAAIAAALADLPGGCPTPTPRSAEGQTQHDAKEQR